MESAVLRSAVGLLCIQLKEFQYSGGIRRYGDLEDDQRVQMAERKQDDVKAILEDIKSTLGVLSREDLGSLHFFLRELHSYVYLKHGEFHRRPVSSSLQAFADRDKSTKTKNDEKLLSTGSPSENDERIRQN